MAELHEQLKTQALRLGFDLVGVARSSRRTPHYDRFLGWLEAGMQGEMAYLARHRELRATPCRLLPGCRSVICVAMSYHTSLPLSGEITDKDRVWVSRYAWGRDYHRLLKRRLIRLGKWLGDRRPGTRWRVCVDTAPVLERSWAAQAGLGWIGRSTMLLNRRLGSELFLGVLLTDADLPEDHQAAVHCGRCTACLDVCPTSALVIGDDHAAVLDARRCVAYLTVEHRGAIAEHLHPAIGAMVAGCDLCQEVCPFTRHAPADLHPELQPALHRFAPRLHDMAQLQEHEYREWRMASPLGRISYSQFRRNLAIVQANLAGACSP